MHKPYTLVIPSWYPTDTQSLNGIFIEKHVRAISTFRNVMVMYVTGDQKQHAEEKAVSDSYTSYTYYYAESSSRGFNQLKYIWAQIRAYRYIVSKYGRPDSLHLHVVFPAGIFVYLLLLCCDIPLIITEHWTGYMDEDGRYMRLPSLARYITRNLFKKSKKISVVSAYFKQILVRLQLADDSKIMTVYNTLNIPKSEYKDENGKTLRALYIGNLIDEQKNISVLINAVGIVAKEYPSFSLTLVGGGVEIDKFKKMAEEKGLLDKNIFFKGYIANEKLEEIYQAHSFFILTSNFETFNIAAAEAMLSGLPVVSSRCGGPTEFVNEHTGIWIEKNTAQDTATAILKMIGERDKFNSHDIAIETQNKFSDSNILVQLRELYSYLQL